MKRLKENIKRGYRFTSLPGAVAVAAAILFLMTAGPVWAVGTTAGTVINNSATADYNVGGVAAPTVTSAAASFTVEEIIDVTVTWEDASNVLVGSPDSDYLTYRVTNTGNGPESFGLLFDDALAGDDFNPAVQSIWMESGAQAGLQTSGANADTQYVSGSNDPNLANDADIVVYVLSNIGSGLAAGNTGNVQLTAQALTTGAAGAAAGTVLSGLGVGGGDAVVGNTNADGDVTGTYQVDPVVVNLTKSIVQTADTFGGNNPFPGATVTYRIVVSVTGSGTAQSLVVADAIPGDMTYVANSITLDTVAQTDAVDGDNTDFGGTTANTVTVNLGDTPPPATFTIEFNATIN